jgi:hypothetical protein
MVPPSDKSFFRNSSQEFLESFTHNSEKIGLIAGLRGDYTSFYDKYFLTPRLHFRYSPNTDLAFKLDGRKWKKNPFYAYGKHWLYG